MSVITFVNITIVVATSQWPYFLVYSLLTGHDAIINVDYLSLNNLECEICLLTPVMFICILFGCHLMRDED